MADPNQFLQDLRRGGCRVIALNRRDALRHAIATLKTYSINCRFDTADPSPRPSKFAVDVSELVACLKYLDNQRVEASAILHYDELCMGLEASDYAYLLTDSRHLLTI